MLSIPHSSHCRHQRHPSKFYLPGSRRSARAESSWWTSLFSQSLSSTEQWCSRSMTGLTNWFQTQFFVVGSLSFRSKSPFHRSRLPCATLRITSDWCFRRRPAPRSANFGTGRCLGTAALWGSCSSGTARSHPHSRFRFHAAFGALVDGNWVWHQATSCSRSTDWHLPLTSSSMIFILLNAQSNSSYGSQSCCVARHRWRASLPT